MDLSEFLSVCEPHLSPPMLAKDLQDNNSMISFSQSKVSSINKMLLQVLSPSEDTIKTCLNSDQHENTVNDNNACDQSTNSFNTLNLNIDRLYLKTCRRFGSELDYINSYDAISDRIFSDAIDKILLNIVNQNNLSLAVLDIDDNEDLETLYYQYYDDYQALPTNQHFTYNDYVKLRANTFLLARLGYKLTITLNTDNDKPETWNPKVAKKILSVDYSPLSLVKDCYPAQASLDQLETLLLAEVVNAFQDYEPNNLPDFSINRSGPSPARFISICMKLRSLRKLHNGSRFGRRDLFIWNRSLHDKSVSIIESFPDRWKKDAIIESILSLIIIFNPDQVGITFADSVR
uniref:Uncharacterized protein n=1 Tax=Tetranychus urticae TaxID=32264 RepID=T1L6J8_TETUR